jgi:competence protein ComEC
VAILASALELLFGAARVPRAATRVAACATAALYVAMLGFPPPAVRALGMLAVTTAARLAQRLTSPWAALAIASALPLALRVDVVLDLGYQLSVTGMAALIAGGTLARRVFRPRLTGAGLAVARELATSTVATLATAPLVAWWFGQVSLVGPLANLVAAPVVGLLQPTLFLALAAAPVAPEAARFVAGAAHPLLVALDVIARAASGLPQAVARVAPSLLTATVAALAAAALLVACASARPARALTVALTAAAALAWLPGELVLGSGTVELHMLDVGQGDALALRTPRGRWVLFDAGPAWGAGDAGRRVIIPYLRRRGGGVAAFVLSHPHLDHVGGASSVIGALRPGEYWDAGFPGGGDAYRASLASAGADAVPWRRARAGDSLVVDDVRIRFLAPDSAWAASLPDANDASAVALVDFRGVRFLLVGDAERAEEEWLLANARDDLQADVLKVGHHGSRTSSTPAFLAAVRPRVALVSVGLGNEYGHPSPDVMGRLAAAGADVLRSDLLGSVVVRTDGHHLTVIADDLEWPVSSAVPGRASPRRW